MHLVVGLLLLYLRGYFAIPKGISKEGKIMTDAIALIISLLTDILDLMPNTPFIYLYALAIVLVILEEVLYWVTGSWLRRR